MRMPPLPQPPPVDPLPPEPRGLQAELPYPPLGRVAPRDAAAPPESLTGAHPALEAAIVMVSVVAFGLAVATLHAIGSPDSGAALAAGDPVSVERLAPS